MAYLLSFVLAVMLIIPLFGCAPPEQPAPSPPPQPAPEPSPAPAPAPEPQPQSPPVKEPEPAPPPPRLEPVDNPPEIIDYYIPGAVYCWEEIYISIDVLDDSGIDVVLIIIQAPDTEFEVPLHEAGSPWEVTYVPEKPGSYIITAIVIDNNGHEIEKLLGTVEVREDNSPEIVDVIVPELAFVYFDFDILVEARDDRGISEVRMRFEKNGELITEITLELIKDGFFGNTMSFTTCGHIDYTVTVTDTKGQVTKETGEIVSGAQGGGNGPPPGPPPVPPPLP